jgi:hypothetical protein
MGAGELTECHQGRDENVTNKLNPGFISECLLE